jgi:hypothetical protein
MTHVVAPAVVAILDILHERVLTASEIGAILGDKYELEGSEDASVEQIVEARLDEMTRMDLADRIE